MKKVLAAAAVLGLAALSCGCGTDTVIKSEKSAGKQVTLDWYINYSWYTTTWGNNLVSDAITDLTGVSVDFKTPKGSEWEKMEAMISSNTLPDLVTLGWWEDQYQEMIEQGQVYALNELADEYAPEFYDVADESILNWYRRADGNVYCYPNSSCTPKDMENYENLYSNQNFVVRKDIYEAIGSPDMTTPEGFMNAVRKAAQMFPEVDGEPLIPIGADEFTETGSNSFDLYLKSFLAVPYEENGEYYERNLDPDYLSWLKVFRQLGEEGYLKDDIFIDKRTQMEQKLENGRYFCLFYQNSDLVNQQKILMANHPERIYIAVDGPKNSRGDDPALPVTGINGWTITLISKNCKDPETAIKFLTYLLSEEGQKMIYLGVEGEMYDEEDGNIVEKPEILELLEKDRTAYNKKYGADNTYWMLQNNVMQSQWDYDQNNIISQMKEWTKPYTVYTSQYDLNFMDSEEGRKLKVKMERLWGAVLPKLLLADSDQEFDTLIEEYKADCEKAGYEEFCRLATAEYENNKEKLGL